MVTGSYFIIQGLELQGVKAICVDTASGAVLPTQNSESEPLPTEGLQCSGRLEWSNVWGLLMPFDIAACVFAYYIFLKERAQHDSSETSGLCPHGYCLNTVVARLVVHHCLFCWPRDS